MRSKIIEFGGRFYAVLTLAALTCLMAPGAALAKSVGGSTGASIDSNDITQATDNGLQLMQTTGNKVGVAMTVIGVFGGLMSRNWRVFAGIFVAAVLAKWALDGGLWNSAGNVGDVLQSGS